MGQIPILSLWVQPGSTNWSAPLQQMGCFCHKWSSLSTMSKLSIPLTQVGKCRFPSMHKQLSTRQYSSHAATPCTWQSCRHYQSRQKNTPESLFLTCQAGFRCRWGRRAREWLSSTDFPMSSVSPQLCRQVIQHLENCFFTLCLNLQHIFANSLFG